MITYGFIFSCLYGTYDFKMTAFVQIPLFLIGITFVSLANQEIYVQLGGPEPLQTSLKLARSLILAAMLAVNNYLNQKVVCELIIEKWLISK